MDKNVIRDIVERIRECADDLSDALEDDDEDDLEYAVDDAQGLLIAAGKTLREMI